MGASKWNAFGQRPQCPEVAMTEADSVPWANQSDFQTLLAEADRFGVELEVRMT